MLSFIIQTEKNFERREMTTEDNEQNKDDDTKDTNKLTRGDWQKDWRSKRIDIT